MKGKNKPISLIFISLLALSTMMIIYTPVAESGPFTNTTGFKGTIEPQVVSGAYPYPTVNFTFNINFTLPTDKVKITFPTGWSNVSAVSNNTLTTWTVTEATTDFTFAAPIGTNVTGVDLFYVAVVVKSTGTNTWNVTTFSGTTKVGSATVNVYVTPWFDAKISPIVTNKKVSKVFTITVKNNASTSALKQVDIVYGADYTWTGDYDVPDGWSLSHNSTTHTFTLAASAATYYIKYGYEKTFKFNMTSADVSSDKIETWTVTVTNVDGVTDTLQLNTYIDVTPPSTFDWVEPTGYAGYISIDGGYIWLNITFNDKYYGADYWPTVAPNVTQFTLYSKDASPKTIGSQSTFAYKFRSATIPDGKLVVHFNITDCVGNSLSKQEVITVVDNIAPVITIAVEPAQSKIENGVPVWYVGPATTTVNIWVNFTEAMQYTVGTTTYKAYDTSLLSAHKIGLYINGSWQNIMSFTWDSAKKWYYAKVTDIPVEKGKCYQLFANITDAARPHNHTSSTLAYLKFDLVKPSIPTFTVQPICGGAIIRALNATDNVGVLKYRVYIGTTYIDVPLTDLQAPTLTPVDNHRTFAGILVLNLTGYAGKTANITISAVDYGDNEGPSLSKVISVPVGRWYPIELQAGWNLISLPLVPNSTSTADIYALILKQGPSGVKVTYAFNNTAKIWIKDPTTITDGNGYFVYMNAYDVLIVHGLKLSEVSAPTFPRTYTLYKGWNLVGFTETKTMNASQYIESLTPGSYYRWLYKWNSAKQNWYMVDTKSPPTGQYYKLDPGQGFWIYIYAEKEDLIPPIDP